MEKHERIRRWNILLAVIVVVLAGICAFLIYTYREEKAKVEAEVARVQIQKDMEKNDRYRKDSEFYDKYKYKLFCRKRIFERELYELADEQYDMLYLSNTDSFFEAEWINTFLGKTILVTESKCESLSQISKYLDAAVGQGNVSDVYLEIDTYSLEKNYYAEHKYGETKQTFMQAFTENFFNCVGEHRDVTFHMIIPIRSLKTWNSYSLEEYTRRIEALNQYIKFCGRYSNIVINSMATEEWLIANESLFDDKGYLLKQYCREVFALSISNANYQVDYNNFSSMIEELGNAVINDSKLEYYRPDYSAEKYVFIGDSMFSRYASEYLNIPGMFEGLTGPDTYNLAIRGSTACSNENGNSFNDVVDALLGDQSKYGRLYENTVDSLNRLGKIDDEGRNVTFIILYGFNDYCANAELGDRQGTDETTFYGALNSGIAKIKKVYPGAKIVLASPICSLYNEGGKKPVVEGGNSLSIYINAIKKCAGYNEIDFLNLYTGSGINLKNGSEYISDNVHPNTRGNYLVTRSIIRYLISKNVNK